MTKELQVVSAEVLSPEDVSELEKHIEATINAHKNNRQAINRLVFESMSAITESDRYRGQLSNRGRVKRFIGGITGSNSRLQNRINSSYAAAQYAGQQTMQKLAEQNLLSFDLIAAVNNKLNASLCRIDEEFNNIYSGLSLFLKQNRSDMIQLENRIKKLERNVNLLNWQSSIEYQLFDGVEYCDLSDIAKIVCLVRDFIDITEGNFSTSDLLLLKSAMSDIGISPKATINYFDAIKCIDSNPKLKAKLLGNKDLSVVSFDESLLFIEGLKKLELLSADEKYIVDTVADLSPTYDSTTIKNILTKKFMANLENVELDVEVPLFEFLLELVYNIYQLNLLLKESLPEILEKANILFEKKEYKEALELFLELGEANIPEAQNMLGDFYKNGYGIDKDITKAIEWYIKAAEQGYADAQCNLGNMYNNGNGVEQDYTKAVEWFTKAADLGHVEAQTKLGNMYRSGNGVEQDYTKAVEWFAKAADQGYARAQNNLGAMYQYGMGVEQDYAKAVEWYIKAAEQGYATAQNNLGSMYEKGYGVEQDYAKAFEWYKKAAEQGFATAQNNLGIMYEKGNGVEQDYTKAFEWYKKAAEQGYATAQNNLGIMYEKGYGVEQDYTKAQEWYKKASQQKGESDISEYAKLGLGLGAIILGLALSKE